MVDFYFNFMLVEQHKKPDFYIRDVNVDFNQFYLVRDTRKDRRNSYEENQDLADVKLLETDELYKVEHEW